MSFRLFSSFLTAGNKSKCGTLQRLTHPRQSTVEPILRPVSSQNRQASQRKTFALSSASAQTSSRLRIHGTFALLAPTPPAAPPIRPLLPRRPDTPIPTPKSHVIPPGPHSPTAQKPRNINDPISKPETFSWELRAKLLSCTRFLGTPARRPPRGLRGLAAVPVGGGRARTSTRTPDWRPTRGLRGLAGLRADAPSEARGADGERAGRPRGGRRSGGQSNAGDLAGPQPQQAAPRPAAAQ